MKILLVAVNAKYIHSNPAVYSLKSYIVEQFSKQNTKSLNKQIDIAEYTINQRCDSILADIYERAPEVVAFSCYIWNWTMIQEVIKSLHKVMPDLPIWLGGPEVTYQSQEILMEYPFLSGIMVGEGEVTFQELANYYIEKDTTLEEIPGLCLPTGYTPFRELTDLTQIPFLYDNLEAFANRIIYYESSRGCPYRCSYCLSSIDKRVRLRDIEVVKKELQFFLDHKVKQVKFVDRTFNCVHEHAMEIWQYLYEHDNDVTNFHFEIAAHIMKEDEIALLNKMRPGFIQLEIGVQSVNQETLKAIHRDMDFKKLEDVVEAIHRGKNIHQHLDLIAGLPYEDYSSFQESFRRVYNMEPQQLQLGFLKVLRGSEMYEKREEYGIGYGDSPPYEVLYTKWLSYKDVLKLKRVEEMLETYYNSNQFRNTLSFLKEKFVNPFHMFEQLADYYEEKGYLYQHPARTYRYDILLQFCVQIDSENSSLYQELLLYDLYLRENVKKRPEFAGDIIKQKDYIRNFYMQEEKNRRWLANYQEYDARQLQKMTHLECFQYPVWNLEEEKGGYVLFDYKERNPLTQDARTVVFYQELGEKM